MRGRPAGSARGLFALAAGIAACAGFAATVAAADAPAKAVSKGDCPEPAVIVRRLQERYDKTRAFRAEFLQETQVVALGDREQARGTVAFQKPGRMRWHFTEPTPQEIVSDGTTLWIYQPAERQVLRTAFKAAFVSTTPVSFLAGVGRISDDFRAETGARPCTQAHAYVLLVSKNGQDLGSLELTVERAAFDIVGAAVTDPLGNVTTVTFSKLERNVDLPEETFRFEVPDGVDVVVAPGG